MLYFAYGSNMNWKQMTQRCPASRFECVACLPDHRLVFPRPSKSGCGVASVEPFKGDLVWGVVYEVTAEDLAALDAFEGYRSSWQPEDCRYVRHECWVEATESGAQVRLNVITYVANAQPNPPKPSAAYLQLIIEGAQHWQLPADYIRRLKLIEVQA